MNLRKCVALGDELARLPRRQQAMLLLGWAAAVAARREHAKAAGEPAPAAFGGLRLAIYSWHATPELVDALRELGTELAGL